MNISKCMALILKAMLGSIILLISGCALVDTTHWRATPVPMTPTPHYAPMVGQAYIVSGVGSSVIWHTPTLPRKVKTNVATNTPVDILDFTWHYAQSRFGDTMCYMYYVQVTGTQVKGWVDQDNLTQEYGKRTPAEQWCFRSGQPTPTPSLEPLEGTVYINVGEGFGVAGSYIQDPREHTKNVLGHSLRVDILNSFWVYYEATEAFPEIACYMYLIIHPSSMARTWLPEDALSPELIDVPRPACFPNQTPPSIYKIAPIPPEGFKVILPESNVP